MVTETKRVTTFAASDIFCEGCASAIRRALAKVPGVSQVNVDIDAKTVRAEHGTTSEIVAAALERAGFPAATKDR